MAQGEFWIERQNWARWPRVIKVNRHTDHGTETRRYLPERSWSEREYAVGKIAELKAENAKLLEDLEDQEGYDQILRDRLRQQTELCVKAEAENAKLRELVADAWGYINHPANATWTHKKRKEVRDSIGDRMRELGVEVG